jgi:hypothetical protein
MAIEVNILTGVFSDFTPIVGKYALSYTPERNEFLWKGEFAPNKTGWIRLRKLYGKWNIFVASDWLQTEFYGEAQEFLSDAIKFFMFYQIFSTNGGGIIHVKGPTQELSLGEKT